MIDIHIKDLDIPTVTIGYREYKVVHIGYDWQTDTDQPQPKYLKVTVINPDSDGKSPYLTFKLNNRNCGGY